MDLARHDELVGKITGNSLIESIDFAEQVETGLYGTTRSVLLTSRKTEVREYPVALVAFHRSAVPLDNPVDGLVKMDGDLVDDLRIVAIAEAARVLLVAHQDRQLLKSRLHVELVWEADYLSLPEFSQSGGFVVLGAKSRRSLTTETTSCQRPSMTASLADSSRCSIDRSMRPRSAANR